MFLDAIPCIDGCAHHASALIPMPLQSVMYGKSSTGFSLWGSAQTSTTSQGSPAIRHNLKYRDRRGRTEISRRYKTEPGLFSVMGCYRRFSACLWGSVRGTRSQGWITKHRPLFLERPATRQTSIMRHPSGSNQPKATHNSWPAMLQCTERVKRQRFPRR